MNINITNKNQTNINYTKICNSFKVFKISLVQRLMNMIISLFKIEPLQVGFYNSSKMKEYINKVYLNYDTIIFHTIRASQYLPKNFEEFMDSERKYIKRKQEKPYSTDLIYFCRALSNILLYGARSK